MPDTSHASLFSPWTLGGLTLRNRIIVSPMCQYSATEGVAGDWHLVHLGGRAVGGAGLVIAEATAVRPDGRITPGCTGLWNDQQAAAFAPIVRFVRAQGAAAAVQLAHAGRKASTAAPWDGGGPVAPAAGGWPVVGASPIPFGPGFPVPHPLGEAEIAELVAAFAAAARRAHAADFDILELHMAHGYLLHSFLSPLTNRRTDSFGGALENRMRLPLQVAEAVRAAWPSPRPLFVRISATDWVPGGWDLEQSVALGRELKARGVDVIDVSTGGLVPDAKVPVAPGFQVSFAAEIRNRAQIATTAVGLVTEPRQADVIVREGKADAVMLARELLRDPYWPLHAATSLGVEVPWPKQYLRAKPPLP